MCIILDRQNISIYLKLTTVQHVLNPCLAPSPHQHQPIHTKELRPPRYQRPLSMRHRSDPHPLSQQVNHNNLPPPFRQPLHSITLLLPPCLQTIPPRKTCISSLASK